MRCVIISIEQGVTRKIIEVGLGDEEKTQGCRRRKVEPWHLFHYILFNSATGMKYQGCIHFGLMVARPL